MKNCENLKISQMPGVHHLAPCDLIPIVHKGNNHAIKVEQLIDQLMHLMGGPKDLDPKIMCLLQEAKNMAARAESDAAQALRSVCEALTLARKAYDMYTHLDSRVSTAEQDIYVLKKLNNTVNTIQRQLNFISQRVEDLDNIDLTITPQMEGDWKNYILKKNGEVCQQAIAVPTKLSQLTDDLQLQLIINKYNSLPKNLSELNDVNLQTPQTGDVLYYNGQKWVNSNLQNLVQNIVNNMPGACLWKMNNNNELEPVNGSTTPLRVGPVYSQD